MKWSNKALEIALEKTRSQLGDQREYSALIDQALELAIDIISESPIPSSHRHLLVEGLRMRQRAARAKWSKGT